MSWCDVGSPVVFRHLSSLRVVSKQPKLVVVGGGNMGSALVHGLLRGGYSTSNLSIVDVNAAVRSELVHTFPDVLIAEAMPACDEAVIAVKPQDVSSACASAVAAGAQRVVSIAAGVSLVSLQRACGEGVRVVRAMPNTPALVGLAATAMAASATCTAQDRAWARALLETVGIVIEVDETMLDAFTGLVGSGPAYVFYVAEALQAAGIAAGFDNETSATLVAQLLTGAASLLQREPLRARELRERVTSPQGTTAAGIAKLGELRVADAIVAAVQAATQRSKELGAK